MPRKAPASDGPRHPIQPFVVDAHGTRRFKENRIVRFLLENGPFDMNKLAREAFSTEDRDQFHQLIGYSVSGAPLSADIRDIVDTMANGQIADPRDAELAQLRMKLAQVREGMRDGVAALFDLHVDDLITR